MFSAGGNVDYSQDRSPLQLRSQLGEDFTSTVKRVDAVSSSDEFDLFRADDAVPKRTKGEPSAEFNNETINQIANGISPNSTFQQQ